MDAVKNIKSIGKPTEIKHIPIDICSIPEYCDVFSFPKSDITLRESIQLFGIIQPVLGIESASDVIEILCGSKRLIIAKELGFETIPAHVYPRGCLSPRDCFDIAFAENSTARRLNVVECAGVISILADTFNESDEYIAEYFFPVMREKSGRRFIENYRSIFLLEERIKRYLVFWNISASISVQLCKFSRNERTRLFDTVENLQLHGGKLKQFLTLCFEIVKRDSCTIEDLFKKINISDILDSDTTTRAQRQRKIIDRLKEQRFPRYTVLLKEFDSVGCSIKGLKEGAIAPPQNFEGDSIDIHLSINSIEELDAQCAVLQDKDNREKIRQLLKLF